MCDITANPSGGTGTYTYLWDDPGAVTTQSASNLSVRAYKVIVTDENGCTADSTYNLGEPDPIVLNSIDVTAASGYGLCDGTATVHVLGGTKPYQYKLLSGDLQADSVLTGLCAGVDTAVAVDDNGCGTSIMSFEITEPKKQLAAHAMKT